MNSLNIKSNQTQPLNRIMIYYIQVKNKIYQMNQRSYINNNKKFKIFKMNTNKSKISLKNFPQITHCLLSMKKMNKMKILKFKLNNKHNL